MSKVQDSPAKAEGDGAVLSSAQSGDSAAKKSPAEWAQEFGHVDAGLTIDPVFGAVLARGADRSKLQGWVFKAAAAKAGWGSKVPEDVQLSKAEYEAAVKAALDAPLSEPKTFAALSRIKAEKAGKAA